MSEEPERKAEEIQVTAIKIEKRLCGALLRQWRPAGMSVETLAYDAANEIERLRQFLSSSEKRAETAESQLSQALLELEAARSHSSALLRDVEHAEAQRDQALRERESAESERDQAEQAEHVLLEGNNVLRSERDQALRELGEATKRADEAERAKNEAALSVEQYGLELHKIGERDGREGALQTIDVATGGDGEYRWSDIQERSICDGDAMQKKIIERFAQFKSERDAALRSTAELRGALRRITEHHDMKSELYTNDANLADSLADIARTALASSSTKET